MVRFRIDCEECGYKAEGYASDGPEHCPECRRLLEVVCSEGEKTAWHKQREGALPGEPSRGQMAYLVAVGLLIGAILGVALCTVAPL